jgi:hypothetical protein
LKWDFYMSGFLAPIAVEILAFLARLQRKAGTWFTENARAIRF